MSARLAVCQSRRDDELAASADLHAWDSFLPTGDQTVQRERNRFAAIPRRIELFTSLEIHAQVVNLDLSTWLCFGAIANDYVGDHQFCGRFAARKFNLGFLHVLIDTPILILSGHQKRNCCGILRP